MDEPKNRAIIEKIKKVTGGVRLFVSTLEQPLFLTVAIVKKDNLIEGLELHPNYLRQLQADSELHECDARAAGILSQRDYSIGEFRRKLKLKSFGDYAIKNIVQKYKSRGLLDDKKYAAKIVNRILGEKPSGKPFLVAALRRKLIPRELADEIVNSLFESQDDAALAVAALEKRWRQFGEFEVEDARRKAYNYLSRRGFSYSASKGAFCELWQKKSGGKTEEEDY
ncbi:MAG: regulatory protein RecX [Candidatus Zixiibacteriota bacterium]